MTSRTPTAPVLLALIATLIAASAPAAQLFDFDAQAVVPTTVGAEVIMRGRIVNGNAVPTPIPLDFANYEYTIVVAGLTLISAAPTSVFAGGSVTIYQDATTPADWTNPASFADGTAILSGSLASFSRTMFTATLGSGAGLVDWDSGSRLNDLAAADRLGWPLLTSVSQAPNQVQPGYTERWDGKVEPTSPVVATRTNSWSLLKASYR